MTSLSNDSIKSGKKCFLHIINIDKPKIGKFTRIIKALNDHYLTGGYVGVYVWNVARCFKSLS